MQAPRAAGSRVQHLPFKLVLFALLCALPLTACLILGIKAGVWWSLLVYGVTSVLAFFLYWRDKRQARNQGQRTPEKVLHTVELLGGWPGALLAQQLFRHKTRKISYQILFWPIVLLHQVFWIDWLFLGAHIARLSFL